jgi:hypothetical protein
MVPGKVISKGRWIRVHQVKTLRKEELGERKSLLARDKNSWICKKVT